MNEYVTCTYALENNIPTLHIEYLWRADANAAESDPMNSGDGSAQKYSLRFVDGVMRGVRHNNGEDPWDQEVVKLDLAFIKHFIFPETMGIGEVSMRESEAKQGICEFAISHALHLIASLNGTDNVIIPASNDNLRRFVVAVIDICLER